MDDEKFEYFLEQIQSRKGFSPDKDRCKRIGQELNLAADSVAILLSVLGSLYVRVRELGAEKDELKEIVTNFLQQASEDDQETDVDEGAFSVLLSRMTRLLQHNNKIDRAEKLMRLSSGFLNNATGFATFVDLRPNFHDDLGGFDSLVPVIQFRISTDSSVPAERTAVFQLDLDALDKLKKIIERTDKKIAALRMQVGLPAPIEWDEKP